MARLDEALTRMPVIARYRTNLGLQCWTFMDRVWSPQNQRCSIPVHNGICSVMRVR